MKTLTKEQFAKVMSIICLDDHDLIWSVNHVEDGETADFFGVETGEDITLLGGYYLAISSFKPDYADLSDELLDLLALNATTVDTQFISGDNMDIILLPISED